MLRTTTVAAVIAVASGEDLQSPSVWTEPLIPWWNESYSQSSAVWTQKFEDEALRNNQSWPPEKLTEFLEKTDAGKQLLERLREHSCPYGVGGPGDVTWPRNAPGLEPVSILKWVAVFYGYCPYIPIVIALYHFFQEVGTRQLFILLWLAVFCLLNEKVVKKNVSQPRPGHVMQKLGAHGLFEGSCIETFGMPSSHSALSVGWFVLAMLDGAFRIRTHSVRAAPNIWQMAWIPFRPLGIMSIKEFIVYTVFWTVYMLPVPFMRVALRDHSTDQVFYGSVFGLVTATIYFRVVRCLQRKLKAAGLENQKICCDLIRHNYLLPEEQQDGPSVLELTSTSRSASA
eukprot:TRINITY_DN17059_c1_g1_i1.p1 TRINITY_DN17059_c1_g1~~TRINITY_DN17059_c1_g1_i1.p1  ORF type:complete len:342 (-),score=31.45 TRINITY_DN17059_c1_g1_i1:159-1184(-)